MIFPVYFQRRCITTDSCYDCAEIQLLLQVPCVTQPLFLQSPCACKGNYNQSEFLISQIFGWLVFFFFSASIALSSLIILCRL